MAPLADIFNDAPEAALSEASRLLFGEQNEARATTLLALTNFLALRFQTKTKLWTAGGAIAAGDMLYYNNNWWLATAAVLAADNVTAPSDRAGWLHLGTSGSGGGGVTFLQGTVDPTAAAPAGAAVGTPYINTASKSLWFKVAAADPGAWIQISGGGQLVFPVFRYVRVTHGYADVPTLTGGVPGAGYRGGMFVTEPTSDVGTVLSAYPRDADTASYDYHEFRVIYDASASFAADTAWDWVGKVDGAEHMPAQTTGLTRPEILALLQHADAAAGESKQGTVTLAIIRSTIAAGLAVANSALRAAAEKVFTDWLPAPAGGMGLRWKADGSGLENYEISTDFVLRVVRFVRVVHDAAAPTLTGGVPGDNWRGGAFTTPPVAGGGGTLLGSWPATPDYAAYDYYQFSAEVDTASEAAIVWANNGKRDNENPPDLTGGLSEQEVLDVLATEAAAAMEARRGTITLAEARALNANVTIDAVGGRSGVPSLPDEVTPMTLGLRGFLPGDLVGVVTFVIDDPISPSGSIAVLDIPVARTNAPNWGANTYIWKDGDNIQIDIGISGVGNSFTSITFQVSRAAAMNQALLAAAEAKAAADAAQSAAETAQETADSKAPKTTYDFFISPAPQTPTAPAANIFIPPTDPIAPQGAQDENVPVTFTFRKAAGDVTVETSAYALRLATADAPVVLADPDDATKEFIVWFISETSLGWEYRNSDDSAIANHGVLFVSVTFISRLTLDATNIPPTLDRGASDNGSLVNTKLLKRVIATFPSVGQLGQQIADIMSLIKILKRGGVSQFLSHLSLGADTVSVAPGFSRLVDLRDLTMSVADSAMNFIQESSGAAWALATKIVSGLGASPGHLVGLKFKAISAGTVMQLRKSDGTLMNLVTMKADGSIHFNSYHDEAFEDDAHTIHVATDWSPSDFTGGSHAEAELPVIGEHWPGRDTAGSTDYNGATFAPFVVRLLERGVVAQAARLQLPALDPVQQAAIHFEAEAVWVDTDVQLLSAGSEAVVQYRFVRRTDAPEVFARVYVQVRLRVTRGSVTGRVDDLHLNSTVNYTTHSHVRAGTTEAPALLTAAVGGELVFYSAAPLPAAPRAPTIAVYRAADGGESSFNDFYPELASFDYDQVVLNTDIVSEFRHAAHTDYISHSELYAYARLAASMWVYAIGRVVSGSARVMVGVETGFSAGAEDGDGKAFLVEGEGGGGGTPVTNGAPDYAHLGTSDMNSGTYASGANGGTVGGTPGVAISDAKIFFAGGDHEVEGAVKFLNNKVTYPTTNLPPGAIYDGATGELTLPGSADANTHWIVCASLRIRANSAAGGGGDRVWVRGSIVHGDNERHSNQTYIRYSDLDGDANQAGADSDDVEFTNEARLSITGSVVADGVRKTKVLISAFTQNIAQLNGADDPNANVAILGAHVHAYKITKALGGGGGGGLGEGTTIFERAETTAMVALDTPAGQYVLTQALTDFNHLILVGRGVGTSVRDYDTALVVVEGLVTGNANVGDAIEVVRGSGGGGSTLYNIIRFTDATHFVVTHANSFRIAKIIGYN